MSMRGRVGPRHGGFVLLPYVFAIGSVLVAFAVLLSAFLADEL